MIKLKGISDTSFIPLVARIFVSKKFPEYFFDEKALSLENYIPDDTIKKRSSEYSLMASVARYYNFDSMVKAFIKKYGKSNIIYLGAGFETAYYRLNEQTAIFYEIDLPDIIAARRIILGVQRNELLIAADIFNMEWIKQIDKSIPTLIIVSGVFQYYKEYKIIKFINGLKNNFSNAELIFDATNEKGIKYINKYVKKTGNTNAPMYFYINDSTEFSKKTKTQLIEERVFFIDARKILSRKLKLYTRIAMKIVDDKKKAILLHLKIK
ncbi:MAG: class I SAM-dependent methyltransferase [Clostridiales Family XIII bacterium]|jgi:O-methyltransferase involved in polyketide biosynthesis|nr:class I SAM-dependent methyltransferase [Clostridiales Family XIII bacterium]